MNNKVKAEKKMEPHTECKKGNHKFLITGWLINGGREKAVAMRCQHCLMPLDLQEMDSADWSKENLSE